MTLPFHFPTLPVSIGALLSSAVSTVGVITGQVEHGAAIIAMSAAFGGIIAAIPGIIKARAESKRIHSDVESNLQDKLVAQIYAVHDRASSAWETERRSMRAMTERHAAIIAVLRQSKHEVASAAHYAYGWARLAEAIIKEHDLNIPPFTPIDIDAIYAREDVKIHKIAGVPDDSDPARQIQPANPMQPA